MNKLTILIISIAALAFGLVVGNYFLSHRSHRRHQGVMSNLQEEISHCKATQALLA